MPSFRNLKIKVLTHGPNMGQDNFKHLQHMIFFSLVEMQGILT